MYVCWSSVLLYRFYYLFYKFPAMHLSLVFPEMHVSSSVVFIHLKYFDILTAKEIKDVSDLNLWESMK